MPPRNISAVADTAAHASKKRISLDRQRVGGTFTKLSSSSTGYLRYQAMLAHRDLDGALLPRVSRSCKRILRIPQVPLRVGGSP